MTSYVLRRLLYVVPVVVLVSVAVFSLLHLAGGDPAVMMLGDGADPAIVRQIHEELGLDRPLHEQYLEWLGRIVQGDLGRSISPTRYRVADAIAQRLPVTLQVGALSILLSLLIGLPLGIVAGVRRGSKIDLLAANIAALGLAMPSFLLALLLIFVFSLTLRWLPPSGYVSPQADPLGSLRVLMLPAVTMGAYLAASVTRMTRSSLVEVLTREYILVARAKGLADGAIIRRHALKAALTPVVTVVGLQLGHVLAGSVIVETIFALPGLGKLTIDAIYSRDFPVVQGAILFMSVGFVLLNLAIDLVYGYLDPRIKYG